MNQQFFSFTEKTQREKFWDDLHKGLESDCPCCGRFSKIYTRKLYSTICWQLIRAYRLGAADEWVHSSQLIPNGVSGVGDFAKAKYWGLIVPKQNDDASKKASGEWMLTALGVSFILGKVSVPKHVLVFDDSVIHQSVETASIVQCLDEQFNYSELMGL